MVCKTHQYFYLKSVGEPCCLRCIAFLRGRLPPLDLTPEERERELGWLLCGSLHVPQAMAMDRVHLLIGRVLPPEQWQQVCIEDLLLTARHLRVLEA